MGRRRDSHRRHRELSDRQEIELLGWVSGEFDSEEDRRAAWEAHRHELMADGAVCRALGQRRFGPTRTGTTSSSPRAPFEGERVDDDALREAKLRFLAERGELREDELQARADDIAAKATWTSEAQEEARRLLDAASKGLPPEPARRGDRHDRASCAQRRGGLRRASTPVVRGVGEWLLEERT